MENLGSVSVLLAFCLAVYAFLASLVGGWRQKPFLVVSARRAVYALCFLITVAAGVVVYALITSDFRFAYAASHSNRDMPLLYKLAAWWAGQEGSLLLWSWMLACYSAVVVFAYQTKHRRIM